MTSIQNAFAINTAHPSINSSITSNMSKRRIHEFIKLTNNYPQDSKNIQTTLGLIGTNLKI